MLPQRARRWVEARGSGNWRGSGRSRSGSRGGRTSAVADAADNRIDADCGSFLHQDLGQDARAGRRDLSIYLVS